MEEPFDRVPLKELLLNDTDDTRLIVKPSTRQIEEILALEPIEFPKNLEKQPEDAKERLKKQYEEHCQYAIEGIASDLRLDPNQVFRTYLIGDNERTNRYTDLITKPLEIIYEQDFGDIWVSLNELAMNGAEHTLGNDPEETLPISWFLNRNVAPHDNDYLLAWFHYGTCFVPAKKTKEREKGQMSRSWGLILAQEFAEGKSGDIQFYKAGMDCLAFYKIR